MEDKTKKIIFATVIALIVIAFIIFIITYNKSTFSNIKSKVKNVSLKDKKFQTNENKEDYATMAPLTDNQQLKYQSDSIQNTVDSINRIQMADI